MKKIIFTILMLIAVISASGCGAKESKTVDVKSTEVKSTFAQTAEPKEKETKAVELKATDVYEKSLAVAQKLESLMISGTIKQQMEQGTKKMNNDISFDTNFIRQPVQKVSSKLDVSISGQPPRKTELVYTPEGMAVTDPITGQWRKIPSDQIDNAFKETDAMDPFKQLSKLKPYIDQIKLTTTNDAYKVEIESTGDKIKDFLSGSAEQQAGVKVGSVHYIYSLDRKTYQPKAVDLDMEMEMTINNELMKMKQSTHAQFSNFNSVKDIAFPAEAKLNVPNLKP